MRIPTNEPENQNPSVIIGGPQMPRNVGQFADLLELLSAVSCSDAANAFR